MKGEGTPMTVDGANGEDPAAIRREIERIRSELAETVDVLGARLDVKTRLRERVGRVGGGAATVGGGAGRVLAGSVLVLAVLVALEVMRRRRKQTWD